MHCRNLPFATFNLHGGHHMTKIAHPGAVMAHNSYGVPVITRLSYSDGVSYAKLVITVGGSRRLLPNQSLGESSP